ncbi:winged helix-turn-helix transcriptional regulator [Rhizobium sp. KVB221]|uniref:Winged helix-turn-helix transcriptional regulator n=1 Tax=Rhizobium setariae TaxID=2801340 RepID=A0A937CN41_9HYPH|nr:MarR family winged helix-turn-helix transcriptional regulator [Rhizobium setariae]MBL0371619.1 winged helix-turn-helix transcriptional regulator [Rhizobium setariae]
MKDTEQSQPHEQCPCLSQDYPVSFAIFALARSHRARAAQLLAEIGLFPGQEILLMQLGEKDGQPQKSLCETIGLDHSTVAKSLTRLERCGLIERRKCAEDGRVSQVYLTDKGREARNAICGVWANLEQMTVQHLTPAEQAQLISLAERIKPCVG